MGKRTIVLPADRTIQVDGVDCKITFSNTGWKVWATMEVGEAVTKLTTLPDLSAEFAEVVCIVVLTHDGTRLRAGSLTEAQDNLEEHRRQLEERKRHLDRERDREELQKDCEVITARAERAQCLDLPNQLTQLLKELSWRRMALRNAEDMTSVRATIKKVEDEIQKLENTDSVELLLKHLLDVETRWYDFGTYRQSWSRHDPNRQVVTELEQLKIRAGGSEYVEVPDLAAYYRGLLEREGVTTLSHLQQLDLSINSTDYAFSESDLVEAGVVLAPAEHVLNGRDGRTQVMRHCPIIYSTEGETVIATITIPLNVFSDKENLEALRNRTLLPGLPYDIEWQIGVRGTKRTITGKPGPELAGRIKNLR